MEPFYQQALVRADCPDVEVLDASRYRVRFLNKYALDIHVLSLHHIKLKDACDCQDTNSSSEKESNVSPLFRKLPDLSEVWKSVTPSRESDEVLLPSNASHQVLNKQLLTVPMSGCDYLKKFFEVLQHRLSE